MKTIKPNKKIQKQVNKDVENLFGKITKVGSQGWKENYYRVMDLKKVIRSLYLVIDLLAFSILILTIIILLQWK